MISSRFIECGLKNVCRRRENEVLVDLVERVGPKLLYKLPKFHKIMFDRIEAWDWIPLRNQLIRSAAKGRSIVVYCSTVVVAEELHLWLYAAHDHAPLKYPVPRTTVLTRESIRRECKINGSSMKDILRGIISSGPDSPQVVITTTCLGAGMSITERSFEEAYLFAEFGPKCPGLIDVVQLSGRMRCIGSPVHGSALKVAVKCSQITQHIESEDASYTNLLNMERERLKEMERITSCKSYALAKLCQYVRDAGAVVWNKNRLERG